MQPTFNMDQLDAHGLLAQVGAGRATANYGKNQIIYNQGDDAEFVFFLQEGRVKLTAFDQGLERVLGIVQEGHFFGEAFLLDVPLRIATATAITDCRITSVKKAVILSAIHAQPRFARLFIDYLLEHNSWIQKKDEFDHLLIR
jgi:CRP/FNR family transcriptional regulator, cyclic AMP receptor protein